MHHPHLTHVPVPTHAVEHDPPPPPLEAVAAEIRSLGRRLSADACRWLVLLAEFDRRNGWVACGMRSCAQWLSHTCGLGLAAAREHVRVARALAALPAVSASFAAGRLSYSKVRALTRIATPEIEAELLPSAETVSGTSFERFIRDHRRRPRGAKERPPGPADYLTVHQEADGTVTVTARLGPEQGALFLARLQAVRDGAAGRPGDAGAPNAGDRHDSAPSRHATTTDGGAGDVASVTTQAIRDDVADDLPADLAGGTQADAAGDRGTPGAAPEVDALLWMAEVLLAAQAGHPPSQERATMPTPEPTEAPGNDVDPSASAPAPPRPDPTDAPAEGPPPTPPEQPRSGQGAAGMPPAA